MKYKKLLFVFLAVLPYIGICLDSQRMIIRDSADMFNFYVNILFWHPFGALCLTEIIYFFIKDNHNE